MPEEAEEKLSMDKLDPFEAAKVLKRMGWSVTHEDIENDLAEGAPGNDDGTINVVKYAAWLLMESKNDD